MRARLLLVGGIALVLAGAIGIGFVVSSVLAGDADTGEAQDRLAAEFAESQTVTTATTTTEPPEDDPTMLPTVTTTPGEDVAGPELRTTTTVPDLLPESPPAGEQALGRIIIPAADVDWIVVEGVSLDALALGPGHMPGTAMPGQPGNAVISGHRTTHGAPFFSLDLLQPGDEITVETLLGDHVYEVVEVRIVRPDDIWVTGDVPGAWLTLTTCNPIYRSIERLVVFARLTEGPNAAAIAAGLTGEETPPRPPEG